MDTTIAILASTTFAVLASVLQAAMSGLIGNRSDVVICKGLRIVAERMRKGGPAANHDLQRGVKHAYIAATIQVVIACNKEIKKAPQTTKTKAEAKCLSKIMGSLETELRDLPSTKFESPDSALDGQIELLLQPDGISAEKLSQEFRASLQNKVLDDLRRIDNNADLPELLVTMIQADGDVKPDTKAEPMSWFNLVCAYFCAELKSNHNLSTIVESKLLAQLVVNNTPVSIVELQNQIQLSSQSVEAVILELSTQINQMDVSVGYGIAEILKILKDIASGPRLSDLTDDPVTWVEVRDTCRQLTYEGLQFLKLEDTIRNHLVPRFDIKTEVASFLQSNSTFMVVVGESGMGKTCMMAELALSMCANPQIACIVRHAPNIYEHFNVIELLDHELQISLSRIKGYSVLKNLAEHIEETECQIVLILDAINEHPSFQTFMRDQVSPVAKYGFPWLKIILSCRRHAWDELKRTEFDKRACFIPGNSTQPFIEVGQFNDREADDVFERLREEYHFLGPHFEELPTLMRQRLRDPLLLRLVAEMYQEQMLPDSVSSLDIDIVPDYIETIKRLARISDADLSFLREEFTRLLVFVSRHGCQCQREVKRKTLLGGPPGVNPAGIYLDNLLTAGLLYESTRGQGLNAQAIVSYRYERFQDYFLGCYIQSDFSAVEEK